MRWPRARSSCYDPYPGYVEYTKRSLDLERLKAADMRVLVEPMWGAGAGWIPRLLAGGKIRVTEIHSERNPWFGGVNPEPIAPNIDEALGILAGGGYDLGLLLDGDADRAGAADEKGTFIHQLEVMGLLMYYLLEHRGLRQPVVSTINETSMVGRLGEQYGVPVYETPVGFKYVGPEDDRDRRHDGRRGVGRLRLRHAPARARRHLRRPAAARPVHPRARGGPLAGVRRRSQHLHDIAGPSFYLRTDVHADRAAYPALKDRLLVELREQAPAIVAGQPVVRTDALDTNDGFKFWIDDGSWLLVRFSGTEPLVRVYAEATSRRAARRDPRPRARRCVRGERAMTADAAASSTTLTAIGAARSGRDARSDRARSRTRCATPGSCSRDAGAARAHIARRRRWRVLGMGGSAIGGDLVRGHLVATGCACRSRSVRGYDLPAWVGHRHAGRRQSRTSGATEETISALRHGARAPLPGGRHHAPAARSATSPRGSTCRASSSRTAASRARRWATR